MPQVLQHYGDAGVPMEVPTAPGEVALLWRLHRDRLRAWLEAVPEQRWHSATRCSAWSISDLVQHLASGSQFLGYTLHQSKKGEGTRLLRGFDPQSTPGAAAATLGTPSRPELLGILRDLDDRVVQELTAFDSGADRAPAEAPSGRVPAFMSVNHFLFDSWVHERDLMIPAGETPPVDAREGAAVVSYALALAGCARWADDDAPRSPRTIDVHLTDIDVDLAVMSDGKGTIVHREASPPGSLRLSGRAGDVVDMATGRTPSEAPEGDPQALDFVRELAAVMR